MKSKFYLINQGGEKVRGNNEHIQNKSAARIQEFKRNQSIIERLYTDKEECEADIREMINKGYSVIEKLNYHEFYVRKFEYKWSYQVFGK